MMPETRHYCPHCGERVSLSTFHRHKRLYYNETSRTWTKKSDVLSDSGSEYEQDFQENELSGSALSDVSDHEGMYGEWGGG